MENQKNRDIEFSFATLFKIFQGKFKKFLAVLLAAAILGGALGAVLTLTHEKVYESTLTFYLPTSEKSNYASVIPLLESELFLEKILIDTKTEKYEDEEIRVPKLPFTKEDKAQYMQLSLEILQAQENIAELKRYFSDAPYDLEVLREELERKDEEYKNESAVFEAYTSIQDVGIAEKISDYETKVNESQDKLREAKEAYRQAANAYNLKLDEYQGSKRQLHDAESTLKESSENLDDLLAKYYEEWKTDTENEENLQTAKSGIRFALSKEELFPDKYESSKKEVDENIPRNFLYVSVNISGEKDLAEKVVKNICAELGDFVILNSTPTTTSDIIQATCLSVPHVNEAESASLTSSIIKYALILAALAVALFIALVLFKYYKKNYIDEAPQEEVAKAITEPQNSEQEIESATESQNSEQETIEETND